MSHSILETAAGGHRHHGEITDAHVSSPRIGLGYSQCRFSEFERDHRSQRGRLDQKGAATRDWAWSERELLFGPHNLSNRVRRGPRASALPSDSRRSISSIGRSAGGLWEAQLHGNLIGRCAGMRAGLTWCGLRRVGCAANVY
jgi:hypothetical protein